MLKILFFTALLLNLSFAYKIGDNLDKSIVSILNMKKDKTYILNFFASWCVSCKKELPIVSKMTFPSNSEFIAINVDENKEEGKAFVADLDLNLNVIYDKDNQIISKFNPVGVPAIYFVKNSKVQKIMFGAIKDIDKKILKNLGEI